MSTPLSPSCDWPICDLDQSKNDFCRPECIDDDIRNDPQKFRDWQRQQNEGPPLRLLPKHPPPSMVDDADYNAAQGSHYDGNWGKP